MKTLLTAKAIDAGECAQDWTEERPFGLEQKGGWILMEWETPLPFRTPPSREILVMTVSRERARQAMRNLHKGARWV